VAVALLREGQGRRPANGETDQEKRDESSNPS
jgi:hypothetical protein